MITYMTPEQSRVQKVKANGGVHKYCILIKKLVFKGEGLLILTPSYQLLELDP